MSTPPPSEHRLRLLAVVVAGDVAREYAGRRDTWWLVSGTRATGWEAVTLEDFNDRGWMTARGEVTDTGRAVLRKYRPNQAPG